MTDAEMEDRMSHDVVGSVIEDEPRHQRENGHNGPSSETVKMHTALTQKLEAVS